MFRRLGLIIFLIISFFLGLFFYLKRDLVFNNSKDIPVQVSLKDVIENSKNENIVEVIAENLVVPWEIAFLPGGDLLVTERPGRLLRIGEDKSVIEISGVRHIGEGGLLGLALHPNFESNSFIYLYLTSEVNGSIVNRVERYKYGNDTLLDRKIVLEGILGSSVHDGGRIEFGPDGYLYITSGDAGNTKLSQDLTSLNGKILRITDDGDIPEDNPFGNAIYSYGHRNPQGLVWDVNGNLWSTEHGRSGFSSGFDELNLIEKGKNYGWPTIEGDKEMEGMIIPILHSGSNYTWAPGDVEIVNGKMLFTGLRGAAIYEVSLVEDEIQNIMINFEDDFGRLRAIRLGPDGFIYITTSNKDGRGIVNDGDDKLIKINPRVFE